MKFQHEVYPPVGADSESSLLEQPVSRQVFIVQDLEIRDRLATSQMNKFLYLYCSKEMPRKAHSNMVQLHHVLINHNYRSWIVIVGVFWDLILFFIILGFFQLTVKALHVRPESGRSPQECCLRVSLMPLRLNIDQVGCANGKKKLVNSVGFFTRYLQPLHMFWGNFLDLLYFFLLMISHMSLDLCCSVYIPAGTCFLLQLLQRLAYFYSVIPESWDFLMLSHLLKLWLLKNIYLILNDLAFFVHEVASVKKENEIQ